MPIVEVECEGVGEFPAEDDGAFLCPVCYYQAPDNESGLKRTLYDLYVSSRIFFISMLCH